MDHHRMSFLKSSAWIIVLLTSAGIVRSEGRSPAEQKIDAARRMLADKPHDVSTLSGLAMALSERARETGDPEYYDQAEKTIEEALRILPGDFESQKTLVWILLGKHEFPKALELAEALNKRIPDDFMVYGLLTDAYVELGNYAEAEAACQWMLDMRPGAVPALARGAYLRELLGDMDGAIELMLMAYNQTPPTEFEYRAWSLCQLAHLFMAQGKLQPAEGYLVTARQLFPDYHYLVAAEAELLTSKKEFSAAAERWEQLTRIAPHPENFYRWGIGLLKAGDHAKSRQALDTFEKGAVGESKNVDNANRELVYYFVDIVHKPEEALRIAKLESARRRDVFTLAINAWALQANGQYEEARQLMDRALAVGIRDARMLYQAGMIAVRRNDPSTATRHFQDVMAVNPTSEWADLARTELSNLLRAASSLPE
jgi:tetratricopeptide (TPR) repeat protein